jgi:hypothetical protein
MVVAAVNEPAVYNPDTVVLDQPSSSIIGFTKSETVYVCPGPDANMLIPATPSITHP